MRAAVGDHIHVHGRVVGKPDETLEIIETRGRNGTPPYLVRHADGRESLEVPGTRASAEHPNARKSA